MSDPATPSPLNEVLQALRRGLTLALGHDLAQVIIYGSQARGEARLDSDIDVLIVVKGNLDYPDLMLRTSQLVADLSLKHDIVISRTFASTAQWENSGTPFLINARREGVAL